MTYSLWDNGSLCGNILHCLFYVNNYFYWHSALRNCWKRGKPAWVKCNFFYYRPILQMILQKIVSIFVGKDFLINLFLNRLSSLSIVVMFLMSRFCYFTVPQSVRQRCDSVESSGTYPSNRVRYGGCQAGISHSWSQEQNTCHLSGSKGE